MTTTQKDDDPFRTWDDSDRTVFVPKPGGRRRGGAAAAGAPPPEPLSPSFEEPPAAPAGGPLPSGVGPNLLLKAAASLFALVRQLRGVRRHDDVPGLRQDLIEAIRAFDADARQAGVDAKTAAQAAYALCALVDETVLGTPWGLDSIWGKQSLLITFYKEYTAGETFFNFLKKAKETPKQYLDLLEFFYVCLSLGFQGRFRLETGGVDQLARIKQDLYSTIIRERGQYEGELSPRWRGVVDKGPRVSRVVPLWVAGVAALGTLLAAYFGFNYSLNTESDTVYAKIASLVPVAPRPTPVPVPVTASAPNKQPGIAERLRTTLAPEIAARLVDVEDLGHAVRIIIYNRGMFTSGGAEVGAQFEPLVRKIGLFISDQAGPFLVTGHTDNVPIRSLRFPSNYDLSVARAEAVSAMLASSVPDATKLKVKGAADTQPIASNATPDGQAQNRRVEIVIPVSRA